MASTKELFASGLCYILREIKDEEELLANGEYYLNIIKNKVNTLNNGSHIQRITNDLKQIKKNIKELKAEFKYYMNEYSYTEQDLIKLNIHAATDEELELDYAMDLKELEYNKSYSEADHRALIDRVNELNKVEDLPLLSY